MSTEARCLTAAHELRGYHTVIFGRCDQASRGEKDPLWCIAEIRKATELCESELNELVKRALLDAQDGVAVIAETTPGEAVGLDLNKIAGEVAATLLALPDGDKIKLVVKLTPGLPSIGRGSAWELYRAVNNLCLNGRDAIKYEHPTGVGGELTIRTDEDAVNVWLSVEDNGRGMSADELAKILSVEIEPKKERGRGLWIVRSTAAALGCEVLCDTELGIGTTFTLCWKKELAKAA